MNLPLNHSLAVAPCLCFLFQELIRHTVWDTLDAYFHAFVYFGSQAFRLASLPIHVVRVRK